MPDEVFREANGVLGDVVRQPLRPDILPVRERGAAHEPVARCPVSAFGCSAAAPTATQPTERVPQLERLQEATPQVQCDSQRRRRLAPIFVHEPGRVRSLVLRIPRVGPEAYLYQGTGVRSVGGDDMRGGGCCGRGGCVCRKHRSKGCSMHAETGRRRASAPGLVPRLAVQPLDRIQ